MTADEVLEGLRALSLDYEPDLRQPDGAWIACCPTCWPLCADGPTLRVIESRRGGYATVSCKSPGCDRDSILLQLRLALKPINGEVVLLIAEESCTVARWALQEVERLRSENARLRAAIEPRVREAVAG
jgi:hypothetical protein